MNRFFRANLQASTVASPGCSTQSAGLLNPSIQRSGVLGAEPAWKPFRNFYCHWLPTLSVSLLLRHSFVGSLIHGIVSIRSCKGISTLSNRTYQNRGAHPATTLESSSQLATSEGARVHVFDTQPRQYLCLKPLMPKHVTRAMVHVIGNHRIYTCIIPQKNKYAQQTQIKP